MRVETPRLTLVAATARLARADVNGRADLGELLDADVPEAWPPEVMRDVQEFFAVQLESGVPPGWWHWYAVLKGPRPILIGSGGFNGLPNDEGIVMLGYSVLDAFAGRGYATEMLAGMITWLARSTAVKQALATTFERHHASVKVLTRNGFACKGVSSEDAAASDADRQGRGQLMLFSRAIP